MNLEIPISEYSPFILTILTISRCSGPDPRVLLLEDTKEGLCVLKFFNDEKMFLVIEMSNKKLFIS